MTRDVSRRQALFAGSLLLTTGAASVETFATSPGFDSWTPGPSDWPTRRRGPKRTASVPEANPPSSAPKPDWGTSTVITVVVGEGRVFAGNESYTVAVDPEDGTRLWTSEVPGERLCYRNGVLYSSDGTDIIAALDGETGETRWTVTPEASNAVHDLLVARQNIFVGEDGTLTARDTTDGTPRWRIEMDYSGPVYPALADGRLYVGGPGPLETYRPRTGWNAVLNDGPERAVHSYWEVTQVNYPVVSDSAIFVGSSASGGSEPTVQAFSSDGIKRQWSTLHGQALSSPALAGGIGIVRRTVRNVGLEHSLHGIDLETGESAWRIRTSASLTVPVVAGTLVIVGDSEGTVRAIDSGTGKTVWKRSFDSEIRSIVPTGERLLIVDGRRRLYCLR